VSRHRTTLIALAALVAGIGASQLGSAQADSSTGSSGTTGTTGTTTSISTDTITVNGSDVTTLPAGSDQPTVQATYQTALGDALTNAKQKATFIAQQIGATLGSITNVTETSNSSSLCTGPIMFAQGSRPAAAPSTRRHHKVKAGALVRTAIDPINACNVEADVTVTYAMTPA
jgi:hypothetical protein